jgi:NADPH2:quinone reductase
MDMRAVRYHEHGGPAVLRVEQAPEPVAGAGQVLVRAEAIGANVIDTVFRSGASPWPRPLPGALTGDVVGRVTAVGDGVTGFRVGDRVAGLSEDAAADLVALDADWLARVPEGADAAEATVLSMTAPLALGLLRAGRLAAGETVLVQSAAGGIGHLVVQLARELGAGRVIGTASTAAKRDFVRSLGAEAAGYDEVEGPVDLVLDAVGGEVFDAGLELLGPGGRMVTYGAVGGKLPTVSAHSLFALKWVTGFSMLAWRRARPERARADMADVARYRADGRLRVAIAERVPLAEVVRAHEILDARANLGRVVLMP